MGEPCKEQQPPFRSSRVLVLWICPVTLPPWLATGTAPFTLLGFFKMAAGRVIELVPRSASSCPILVQKGEWGGGGEVGASGDPRKSASRQVGTLGKMLLLLPFLIGRQLEQFKSDNMAVGFGSATRALEQALERTKANIKWVAENKPLGEPACCCGLGVPARGPAPGMWHLRDSPSGHPRAEEQVGWDSLRPWQGPSVTLVQVTAGEGGDIVGHMGCGRVPGLGRFCDGNHLDAAVCVCRLLYQHPLGNTSLARLPKEHLSQQPASLHVHGLSSFRGWCVQLNSEELIQQGGAEEGLRQQRPSCYLHRTGGSLTGPSEGDNGRRKGLEAEPGCHREGLGLFSEAPEGRTRSNGWKLNEEPGSKEEFPDRTNNESLEQLANWSYRCSIVGRLLPWPDGWTRKPPEVPSQSPPPVRSKAAAFRFSRRKNLDWDEACEGGAGGGGAAGTAPTPTPTPWGPGKQGTTLTMWDIKTIAASEPPKREGAHRRARSAGATSLGWVLAAGQEVRTHSATTTTISLFLQKECKPAEAAVGGLAEQKAQISVIFGKKRMKAGLQQRGRGQPRDERRAARSGCFCWLPLQCLAWLEGEKQPPHVKRRSLMAVLGRRGQQQTQPLHATFSLLHQKHSPVGVLQASLLSSHPKAWLCLKQEGRCLGRWASSTIGFISLNACGKPCQGYEVMECLPPAAVGVVGRIPALGRRVDCIISKVPANSHPKGAFFKRQLDHVFLERKKHPRCLLKTAPETTITWMTENLHRWTAERSVARHAGAGGPEVGKATGPLTWVPSELHVLCTPRQQFLKSEQGWPCQECTAEGTKHSPDVAGTRESRASLGPGQACKVPRSISASPANDMAATLLQGSWRPCCFNCSLFWASGRQSVAPMRSSSSEREQGWGQSASLSLGCLDGQEAVESTWHGQGGWRLQLQSARGEGEKPKAALSHAGQGSWKCLMLPLVMGSSPKQGWARGQRLPAKGSGKESPICKGVTFTTRRLNCRHSRLGKCAGSNSHSPESC
ncbi:Aminopeptidase N, partial [Ophiophagus hannah]